MSKTLQHFGALPKTKTEEYNHRHQFNIPFISFIASASSAGVEKLTKP